MAEKKKLTFMILIRDSGWWKIGEVTQQAMAHEGFEVELSWTVREERVARVAKGEADYAVNADYEVAWAYKGLGPYEGSALPDLRAIAAIPHPNWHAFAVTCDSRLSSIEEIKEKRFPLRIYSPHATFGGRMGSGGFITDRLLEAYGFSRSDIESWGGKVWTSENSGNSVFREHNFDAMVYRAYPGYGPVGKLWQEATILNNLRFLPVRSDVLDELGRKYGLRKGLMPKNLMRGVDEDVPTLYFPNFVVYTSKHMSEELAFITAKSFDEHCEYFFETHLPFSYNPFLACKDTGVPLHLGAERYYRSHGYMK